jgi:hypothetical protein
MGLPDFLFDSHKRYKADTNQVAVWLAETAQKYGYTLMSTSPVPTGSGRPKGKARKQEKNATGKTSSSAVAQYKVTTQELVAMAQVIANQRPSVKTPSVITTLLRSAIALRKRCSQWFSEQAGHQATKNQTHSHFVTVLEKILGLIQPTDPDQEHSVATSFNLVTDPQIDTLNNIFDVLNIEESEMAEIESTSANRDITGTVAASPRRRYDVESDDEEVYFALYCFFDDLNRLREYLQILWGDYRNGEEDLVSASVTTNMAFQLVKQAEEELISTLPKLKSYTEISGVFYFLMCHLRGQDPEYRQEHDDVVNPAMLDVAEWLYMPVASAIGSFCNVIQNNHVPVLKPGHFGIYDPTTDRTKLSPRQRIREDRIVLLESFPEFFVAGKLRSHQKLPVPDELTNGLVSTFSTKEAPLWVIYACQVFLDIHHTLRADVSRALSDLRGTGVRASISLKQYFSSSGLRLFTNWPSSNEKGVENLSKFIKQWAVDDAFEFVKSEMLGGGLPKRMRPEPFALLSRHPVLCGLLQFKVYTEMKYFGIVLAGAWGSILYVAHMYNACRQAGYLKEWEVWPDMELIMDIHSRESMFLGQVPKTPEQWLKSMTLMLGVAPESFARFTRVNQLKFSKKGPKMMSSKSPLSDIFQDEYFATGNAALTLETVQKLLDEEKTPTISIAVAAKSSEARSLLHKQWTKSHKMTPLQLLSTLRDAITTEEPMLRFDYVPFHLRCLKLLRGVRDVADEKLTQYFGKDYIDNDSQLPFVVHYIFQVAHGTHAIGEKSRLQDNVRSAMMVKVAEVFREFILREGRAESAKLAKICLNWSEAVKVREIEE